MPLPPTAPRIRSSASAWTSRHDWSLSLRHSGHWPVRGLCGEDLEAPWKNLAYYLWMGQSRLCSRPGHCDPHRKVPGELLPHAVGTLRITPGSPGGRNCWCGREVRLPLASSSVLNPWHPRPSREQFEPNLQKGKRDGPYGKGKGKGQQQQKGKGKSNYRPPGGAASYD